MILLLSKKDDLHIEHWCFSNSKTLTFPESMDRSNGTPKGKPPEFHTIKNMASGKGSLKPHLTSQWRCFAGNSGHQSSGGTPGEIQNSCIFYGDGFDQYFPTHITLYLYKHIYNTYISLITYLYTVFAFLFCLYIRRMSTSIHEKTYTFYKKGENGTYMNSQ